MLITASSTCIPSAGGLSSQRENHITPVSTLLSALGQGNRGTCLNASHMLQVLLLHIYVLFWYCSPKPQHKRIFRTWDRKWVEIRTSLQVKRSHLFDTETSEEAAALFNKGYLQGKLPTQAAWAASKDPMARRALSPEYSFEGLMLKLQYFCHLMRRTDSLEKTLMLGKIEGRRRGNDRGWDGWMASPTQWTWVWVNSASWWWTGRPGMLWFMGSLRVGHDWATELNWVECSIWV